LSHRSRRRGRPEQRRVLFVSLSTVLGGGERSLLALISECPRLGIDGVLACPPGGLADAAQSFGVQVVALPVRSPEPASRQAEGGRHYPVAALLRRGVHTVRATVAIARITYRLDPVLVHSNSLPSHMPAALGARLVGRPVTWHLREIVRPGMGRLTLAVVGSLTRGMVAISGAVRDSTSHARVVVVPNPVSAPPEPMPAPGFSLFGPVVGYLGRLEPSKGIEDLLRAVATLASPVQVAVVGSASEARYADHLREVADRLLPGRVHFLGERDTWAALSAMDVLAVPSHLEPFGRVAVEAQRAGVPVVVADAGGLPEIVTDRCNGLLFPPHDDRRLAAALGELLSGGSLVHRLVAAGIESAHRYDPELHADRMLATFFDLVGDDLVPGRNPGSSQ
jgi:glycosyltransferase involved in cell wall biosynthesis